MVAIMVVIYQEGQLQENVSKEQTTLLVWTHALMSQIGTVIIALIAIIYCIRPMNWGGADQSQ